MIFHKPHYRWDWDQNAAILVGFYSRDLQTRLPFRVLANSAMLRAWQSEEQLIGGISPLFKHTSPLKSFEWKKQ